MAERKQPRSRSRSEKRSAEKDTTEARQRAEHDVGLLDNPDVDDEPSELRHLAYFVAVVGGALVLNLVVLALVAGGGSG